MSTALRILLLFVVSLIHSGWIFDIELELAPVPARVMKTKVDGGCGPLRQLRDPLAAADKRERRR